MSLSRVRSYWKVIEIHSQKWYKTSLWLVSYIIAADSSLSKSRNLIPSPHGDLRRRIQYHWSSRARSRQTNIANLLKRQEVPSERSVLRLINSAKIILSVISRVLATNLILEAWAWFLVWLNYFQGLKKPEADSIYQLLSHYSRFIGGFWCLIRPEPLMLWKNS